MAVDVVQRLDGKVAIITGAAGGIGSATAQLFVDVGAKVMLTDRDDTKLREINAKLGEAAASVAADCTDESAIARVVSETVERFGALDIMIANA